MAVIAKPLVQATTVGAGTSVFYTAPVNTTGVVKQISLTNQTTSAVTVSVWVTQTTAAPTATNIIINEKTLAPKEAWSAWPMVGQAITSGYSIQAQASAASAVTIRVSGLEIT